MKEVIVTFITGENIKLNINSLTTFSELKSMIKAEMRKTASPVIKEKQLIEATRRKIKEAISFRNISSLNIKEDMLSDLIDDNKTVELEMELLSDGKLMPSSDMDKKVLDVLGIDDDEDDYISICVRLSDKNLCYSAESKSIYSLTSLTQFSAAANRANNIPMGNQPIPENLEGSLNKFTAFLKKN